MNRAERPLLTSSQKVALKRTLNQYAEDLDDHRPLSEIAAVLEYSTSCLRYWFPTHCERISAKHAAHKRIEGFASRQAGVDMVKSIVNDLKATGDYVSNRKVNSRLLLTGKTLAKPMLYQVFKSIRR